MCHTSITFNWNPHFLMRDHWKGFICNSAGEKTHPLVHDTPPKTTPKPNINPRSNKAVRVCKILDFQCGCVIEKACHASTVRPKLDQLKFITLSQYGCLGLHLTFQCLAGIFFVCFDVVFFFCFFFNHV